MTQQLFALSIFLFATRNKKFIKEYGHYMLNIDNEFVKLLIRICSLLTIFVMSSQIFTSFYYDSSYIFLIYEILDKFNVSLLVALIAYVLMKVINKFM